MTGLCQLLGDWRGDVPTGGIWAERKWDGWRALRLLTGREGIPGLVTRNGLPIEGVGHILHRLARMEREAGEPLMFDGEFVVDGTLDATKRWCESGHKMGGEAGVYHVFDAIPLSDFMARRNAIPLYERKARLKALWDATQEDEWEWRAGSRGRDEGGLSVLLVEDEWLFDRDAVIGRAREIWAGGGEGVVLKDAEAPYEFRRSNTWRKVKAENISKWSK